MRKTLPLLASAAICTVLIALPTHAQGQNAPKDPSIVAAQQSAAMLKQWLTKSASMMNEADFAFRPTPEVRTFGQIMAHVADRDYEFCAAARGEEAPVRDIEKTERTKAAIERALAGAFAYCDTVYAGMTDTEAKALIDFHGQRMAKLSTLLFLAMHNSLHYGNAITYIRLRGKVPPSTPSPISSN